MSGQPVSYFSIIHQRYALIPLGTVDYLTFFYRVVGWRTRPGEPLPPISPPSFQPKWYNELLTDEQRFIDFCAGVDPEPIDFFCLHFCALLTVEQMIGALGLPGPGGSAGTVVHRLEQCWDVIL